MKSSRWLLGCAVAGFVAALWYGLQVVQGPELAGYQVTPRPLVQTVVATGRVAALSRSQVGSAITGVVLERRVMEGDQVSAGDVLAVLRADDLAAAVNEAEAALAELQQSRRPQALAALREAQARLAQASRETKRRRELLNNQLIARETLEQAVQQELIARTAAEQAQLLADSLAPGQASEAALLAKLANARAQLAKTMIRAEVSGTILTRNVEPGDLVQPGLVLFEMSRSGGSEIIVPLDEKNLEVLASGQSAVCIADAFPAAPFNAKVALIAPSIDPQRGTVDVRLSVDPAPQFLREGMTVSVNIETSRKPQALVVSNDALMMLDAKRALVWRVKEGRAEQRQVELGLRGLTQTEIIKGLDTGDWILADAQAQVSIGQKVRLMAPAEPSPTSDSRNELPARLD